MKKPNDDYSAVELLGQLPKGAFLTVRDREGRTNTMTIAWGSIGFIWQKPVVMVMVRESRFTYQLIEQADDFTVSLPLQGQLKKELGLCGTRSGRDIDKFKEFNLTAREAKQVKSPVIGGCDRYYECRILFKQFMNPEHLAPSVAESCYASHDYHMLYFGEIVACYSASE